MLLLTHKLLKLVAANLFRGLIQTSATSPLGSRFDCRMDEQVQQATFRFYAELNDFLDLHQAGHDFSYGFWGAPAIKDAIEAIGVPHPEVALILINGKPATFENPLVDQDQVSVFPAFRQLDLEPGLGLQPEPLAEPEFIADIHLGQLARYLRMLGFHCHYQNDSEDVELAEQAARHDRVLLTRDQELLKRSIVTRGYYVRSTQPQDQLLEVSRRYQLAADIRPFRYCLECNGSLRRVRKDQVIDQLPPTVREEHQEFIQCQRCRRVYWQGSHVERMRELIAWLQDRVGTD